MSNRLTIGLRYQGISPQMSVSKYILCFLGAFLLFGANGVSAAPDPSQEGIAEFNRAIAEYEASRYQQAAAIFQQSAEKGFDKGQYNLGWMYYSGQGVRQSYRQAAYWYRRAAEQGYADAQFNLGVAYYNGSGVPKDDVQAYFWWNMAANQGIEQASQNKQILAQRMSPPKIAEALRLARNFRPVKGGRVTSESNNSGITKRSPVATDSRNPNASYRNEVVREVQSLLGRLGFQPGPTDGIAGTRTTKAIRAFQRTAGIRPDGVVSAGLLELLNTKLKAQTTQ